MFELVELKQICNISSGGTPSRKQNSYYGGDIKWSKISDLETAGDGFIYDTEEKITNAGLENIRNRIFEIDTLFLAMYGSVGKTAITKARMSCNQAILGITAINDKSLDLGFLKYWFDSTKEKLLDSARGVALKNLSAGMVKDLKIPLPPIKTQQRIASILGDAAALRDKTAQLLTEYDLLAQSIFLEMFGDPVSNSKGWKRSKLVQVSEQITDGTHHSPKPEKSGYPYVTAKHIKTMSLEFDSKPTFVNKKAHEEIYARCKPEFNDVFLIKDGATTGIACLNSFKEPISLLSSVGLIKPKSSLVNPYFLVFWFNHSGIKQQLIRKFMSGAAIKRYTISKMKKFDLIVPPVELQNQFADKIGLIEQQKTLAKQELQESEDLFNCLLQKAFKGELV